MKACGVFYKKNCRLAVASRKFEKSTINYFKIFKHYFLETTYLVIRVHGTSKIAKLNAMKFGVIQDKIVLSDIFFFFFKCSNNLAIKKKANE